MFKGSDIGKEYSAKAILDKCGIEQNFSSMGKPIAQKIAESNSMEIFPDTDKKHSIEFSNLIEGIVSPSEELQYVPSELRKRRKKKRNQINN